MPATYTTISTTTLTSAQSSVTLSSIPSNYTDLILTCSLRATASTFNNVNFIEPSFNGDTTSGLYSLSGLFSRTGTITSPGNANANNLRGVTAIATSDMASDIFSHFTMNLMSYSNTSVFKTVLCRSATGGNLTAMDDVWTTVGMWRNTTAINSIRFVPSAGNFATGSTFTLYGIKSA